MKHFEDSLKCVKKENFNLKLKIFFLEEKLSTGDETSDLSLIQANTDLKVIWNFLPSQKSKFRASSLKSRGFFLKLLREAFKNKNDETYGIFHMLVDPPPPYQHMENSLVIFYCLKRISDSF